MAKVKCGSSFLRCNSISGQVLAKILTTPVFESINDAKMMLEKAPFSKIWLCKFWRRAGDEDIPPN